MPETPSCARAANEGSAAAESAGAGWVAMCAISRERVGLALLASTEALCRICGASCKTVLGDGSCLLEGFACALRIVVLELPLDVPTVHTGVERLVHLRAEIKSPTHQLARA